MKGLSISGDTSPAAVDATLRRRGLRLTAPRRVILEVVRAMGSHPSAADVHDGVRRTLPRVSLATVYRNLRLLAAEGLLVERTGPSGLRFDGNVTPHDHFTCAVCGRVYDVARTNGRGLERRAHLRTGFEVTAHRVEFSGRCAACRSRG